MIREKLGRQILVVEIHYSTTDDVLSGKTFTSTEGLAAEGTMADISGAQRLGTKFTSTNYLGLYPNTAGYYDTTSRVVLARADFGDAVASDVVSGKTFTSSAGWTVTGTYSPNIVQGTFTTGSTRAGTGTTTISYSGSGYPIALMVYVDGGAYNNSTGGNTTWYDSVDRYDVGAYYMTKARIPAAPTYTTSAAANYGVTAIIYKNSTSTSTSYTRTSSMTANAYTSSSTDAAASTVCVRFKGNGTTLSWYVGNATSSTIGLAPSTTYAYIAVYSS